MNCKFVRQHNSRCCNYKMEARVMIKDSFLQAIREKKVVRIKFKSKEKGEVIRKCIPFDYGPSRREKIKVDKFHFYDLDSPDGSHNLSIVGDQLLSLDILDETFNPATYVTWSPVQWFVKREWGRFS